MKIDINPATAELVVEYLRQITIGELPGDSCKEIYQDFKALDEALVTQPEAPPSGSELRQVFCALYENYNDSMKAYDTANQTNDEKHYREIELQAAREELKYFLADNGWWESLVVNQIECREVYDNYK